MPVTEPMISIPKLPSSLPNQLFRPARVKKAMPMTGCGIMIGRSMRLSTIFLPGNSLRAST